MNLQNVPPGICRRMFVADEGKVLLEVDLRNAESWPVAFLSEEDRMIETLQGGGDIHQLIANTLPPDFSPTGSAYENVPNPRRLFAKKHVHAFNYGEGERAFGARASVSPKVAKRIRDRYFDMFPRIKAWQFSVQTELRHSKTMTTPVGRKRTFFGRWGEMLFREAYAFMPQSTVGDTLNKAIINLEEARAGTEFMLQNHDAFVVQVKPEHLAEEVKLIRKAFDIPIQVKGRTFVIPIEFKVGKNWDEMKKVEIGRAHV